VIAKIAAGWPWLDGPKPAPDDPLPWRLIDEVQQKLRALHPQSDERRATLSGALQIAGDVTRSTWLQKTQEADHVPQPFVLILLVWLFPSVRRTRTVRAAQCGDRRGSSCHGAFDRQRDWLIDDLEAPYRGFIVVSPQPMQRALAEISAP
jgi:hypothetical protein